MARAADDSPAFADHSPVVVARAPLRVSLAGGGTDLPSYARLHGGEVISFAIDRHVAVTVYPRSFDGRVRACWDVAEQVSRAEELENRYAREVLRRVGVSRNIQLASFADAPNGTGLGGSGAFTVALLHALRQGTSPDQRALAEEAAAVEMVDLARPVGKHDHYIAAFGGLRALHIGTDLTVTQEELTVSPALAGYLRNDLLLFYTGVTRDAGHVLAAQSARTSHGDPEAVASLRAIHDAVADMRKALENDSVWDIGPLLHRHWMNKRQLSGGVSSSRIDDLYRCAREAGSDGGKLLGAGGGGFLLISCRPGYAAQVRTAMLEAGTQELPFGIDKHGSRATTLGP
ncbi:hypothetical protein [Streptomyces sp. NPDC088812]|uniref:GHMP family kinase ATP-binding protein n=1 Tax=Streptomyces sp. NPDC088812 TaxID=3365905 RepID=UPI003828CA81